MREGKGNIPEQRRRYKAKYPEKRKALRQRYKEAHPEKGREQVLKHYYKIRMEQLTLYSNGTLQCSNCGDNHLEFLELANLDSGTIVLCSNCNIKRIKIASGVLGTTGTSEQRKQYRRSIRVRDEVFSHYAINGKIKCTCPGCTVDDIDLLCIDHINGDGADHRRSLGVRQLKYAWIKKNNYPDNLRILCHNCNQSLGMRDYCPHENNMYPMVI